MLGGYKNDTDVIVVIKKSDNHLGGGGTLIKKFKKYLS
jgi:hypothetical protein